MYSVWLALFDHFIGSRDWVFMILVIRTTSALTLGVYADRTRRSLRIAADRPLWPYLALIGLCDVGAYSAVAFGFSETPNTSVVAVLSSTFSLPTLILARLFLRERLAALQGVAACIILGGIVLLSVQ